MAVLAIVPYVAYLGYMIITGGKKLLSRDDDDIYEEYLFTGGLEVLAIVMIPFSISLQVEIHKLKSEQQYALYDEEKQEYVEQQERKSSLSIRVTDKSAYIKSFALARSIIRRKPN